MNSAELMEQRRRQKNLTKTEIAEQLNVALATVSGWVARGQVPSAHLQRLAVVLDVPVDYFFNGSNYGRDFEDVVHADTVIPMYDVNASMGKGTMLFGEPAAQYLSVGAEKNLSSLNLTKYKINELFMITVEGDSMSPTIEPDDWLICQKTQSFTSDGIYLLRDEFGLRVKRLYMSNNGIVVKSDNLNYPEWTLDNENDEILVVLGKVIKIWKVVSV